ncbi:MAG TPA: prolyl oligopeptidase family serine peptidase [Burkholderiaceae bacterium]|jgi:prolyl oligopeptidase|nr:prolyl oligopeptidase family serine peptidase [Burkholderiaceae bacterium]
MRVACVFVATLCVLDGATAIAVEQTPLIYPEAARDDHVDRLHGVEVADPYRWLENLDSARTRTWVDAEAKLTRTYLDSIGSRDRIAAALKSIWNYERWSPPTQRGGRWFYTHNGGLQNQDVLFVATGPDRGERVLLDPNTLSADGTVALKGTDVTDDGRLLVYGLSEAGSDWEVLHVRDVASGHDLSDEIHWAKFTDPSWMRNGSGFYYTGYEPPVDHDPLKAVNEYHKLYFHRLGTPQSQDRLVYERRDRPDWFIGARVTDDGRYLVLSAQKGTEEKNTLLFQDLARPQAPVVAIVEEPRAAFDFIGNRADVFYLRTDDGAARYRIIAVSLRNPQPSHWKTIVPETPDTLVGATLVGGQLIARYLKDAQSRVRRFDLKGVALGDVALPGIGTADGFAGRDRDRVTTFRFDSFTTPPTIYRLDLQTGEVRLWRRAALAGFDPAAYETRQVFCRSKDGTQVPIFIVSRKGTPQDGRQTTILYGYGGFNIPLVPAFSPRIATWLTLGGVYAVANLRGGGEYGRQWHEAGMKTRKQNVFDDFIAAAQYLQEQKWTDPAHLAILGGSNGGLLVAAAEEQRPDLFAAAVPMVGVLDMLRFRDFTIGAAWESDYGSVDREDEFKAMLAYSPYQNVRGGVDYPPTLIVTADHDDRVYPAHSFKFGAAMQHADPDGRPILLRIETRAGHGQGMPTGKQIEEFADIYAFILHAVSAAGPTPSPVRVKAP